VISTGRKVDDSKAFDYAESKNKSQEIQSENFSMKGDESPLRLKAI
jgi:hypothetical protein